MRAPRDLPVRPTTDFAKTGLFNILANRVDFSTLRVLDLFSGTGHMSLEFASREARSVTAVDQNFRCVAFLRDTASSLGLQIVTVKSECLQFLKTAGPGFDLIFADPPYDFAHTTDIHRLVFERGLLPSGGTLIIEHGPKTDLSSLHGFEEKRKYGNVNFSFFRAA